MRLVGDSFEATNRAFSAKHLRGGVLLLGSLFLLTTNGLRGQTTTNSTTNAANAVVGAAAAPTFSGDLPDTNVIQDFNVPTNPPPADSSAGGAVQSSNSVPTALSGGSLDTNAATSRLAMATYFANMFQPEKAEPILVGLLAGNMPESIQKSALLELAIVVADQNDLPRAQSIDDQYLQRWPGDLKVPEILLHQGQLFRRMGLNDLALGKFYSVMTSALSLKSDQLDYYRSLVLQTQVEIAETHYLDGQFADAADFYSRLMLNTDPALNRTQIQFRLVRSLSLIHRYDQAVSEARDFVLRYPDADQVPEVRYYLAQALKALGQNSEALQEVLLCLREQKSKTANNPKVWAYWQQRVGNEIANQLYHEGDYINSLEIYQGLAQLDPSPDWQVPVEYQMGITYEKLAQPEKAVETYNGILARSTQDATNATSALQAVFDMARWRLKFVQWQTNAEASDHALMQTLAPPLAVTTNLQTRLTP